MPQNADRIYTKLSFMKIFYNFYKKTIRLLTFSVGRDKLMFGVYMMDIEKG